MLPGIEKTSFAFCTIITADYIHYALALRKSLLDFSDDINLYILVSDGKESMKTEIEEKYAGTFLFFPENICSAGIGKKIYEKYYHSDVDAFRWSMKPVFINYLIRGENYSKVIFVDTDIFFYNDYHFLINELDTFDVLLTPHWRSPDPQTDLTNFRSLFKEGIYNGGFIAVSRNATEAMDWWAKACEFICVRDPSQGMYVDQGYLNILPVYFKNVGIVRHKGCNVANWNMVECARSFSEDKQKVLIAEEFPVVFIHYSQATINGILNGADPLLGPYLVEYYNVLNEYSFELRTDDEKPRFIPEANDRIIIKAKQEDYKKRDNNFNVPFTKELLDTFQERTSILNSIKSVITHIQGNVLDISSSDKFYKNYILKNSTVSGYLELNVDNSCLKEIAKPVINWNRITMPFKNNEFQTIICIEGLDYYSKPELLLKEVNRILKPGGVIFFTVSFLSTLNKDGNDKFRYTPLSLKRIFIETGYINIDIQPTGGWHASMAKMLALWVRRSPLSNRRKKIVSAILKPIIKYLIKIDKFSKVDYSKSQMITGLYGIAYKQ